MLPSDMNLNIRSGTVGYNNKILVSDGKFSLGKSESVNALVLEEPVISMPKVMSHKVLEQTNEVPTITHKKTGTSTEWAPLGPQTITHEEEKIALVLSLAGIFTIWYMFR